MIVVGARCAGSPTAMLLARAGLRVLVIDRAAFPSDTISGHAIKPPGMAYLQRWGLLDGVLATKCQPIRGRHLQFGDRVLDPAAAFSGRPRAARAAPRRARCAAGQRRPSRRRRGMRARLVARPHLAEQPRRRSLGPGPRRSAPRCPSHDRGRRGWPELATRASWRRPGVRRSRQCFDRLLRLLEGISGRR